MTISERIFDAFLKCPLKCWLRASNERPTGNAYAEWLQTESESYRIAEVKRLIAKLPSREDVLDPRINQGGEHNCFSKGLKAAKWRLAIELLLSANSHTAVNHSSTADDQSNLTSPSSHPNVKHQSGWSIETCLHAIERIPAEGRGKPTLFIPIRFALQNKIDPDTRMLLAFDTLVLSQMLGRSVGYGRLIHGEKHTTQHVKTSGMTSRVGGYLNTISALLSGTSPPDRSLNRHCNECEFQEHCRKFATERDDLSLLSSMREKERRKLQAKGIFTVTQLSYTFRPRRRAKSKNDNKEKYHMH